jgi:hypothetical protein
MIPRLPILARRLFLAGGLSALWALGVGAGCSDDEDPRCQDACPAVDARRCGGSAIERCALAADGCLAWTLVEDCASSQRVCLDPGSGPACGVLCTDQCSLAQSRCLGTVVQGCAANGDGCLRWVDSTDCADATQICEVASGDASCVPE